MLANLCAFYAVFFIAFSGPLVTKEPSEENPIGVNDWPGTLSFLLKQTTQASSKIALTPINTTVYSLYSISCNSIESSGIAI